MSAVQVAPIELPPHLRTMPTPRTLAEVEAVVDPTARARAAVLYLARLDEHQRAALLVRDAALREATVPAPHLAPLVGVSAATVKLARSARGTR